MYLLDRHSTGLRQTLAQPQPTNNDLNWLILWIRWCCLSHPQITQITSLYLLYCTKKACVSPLNVLEGSEMRWEGGIGLGQDSRRAGCMGLSAQRMTENPWLVPKDTCSGLQCRVCFVVGRVSHFVWDWVSVDSINQHPRFCTFLGCCYSSYIFLGYSVGQMM